MLVVCCLIFPLLASCKIDPPTTPKQPANRPHTPAAPSANQPAVATPPKPTVLEQLACAWPPAADMAPHERDRHFLEFVDRNRFREVATLDVDTGDVHHLAVSPNGRLVAVGAGKEIHIYDLAHAAPKRIIALTRASTNVPGKMKFVDNDRLACAEDGLLSIYDVRSGKIQTSVRHTDKDDKALPITGFAFKPDLSWMVTGGAKGLCFHKYDGRQLTTTRTVLREPAQGHVLEFSPDGTRLAFVGLKKGEQLFMEVWNASELVGMKRIAAYSTDPGSYFVAWPPDSSDYVSFSAPSWGHSRFLIEPVHDAKENQVSHRLVQVGHMTHGASKATPGPMIWLDGERYVATKMDGTIQTGTAPRGKVQPDMASAHQIGKNLACVAYSRSPACVVYALGAPPPDSLEAIAGNKPDRRTVHVLSLPIGDEFQIGEDRVRLTEWNRRGNPIWAVNATSAPDPQSSKHALITIRIENVSGEGTNSRLVGTLTSDDASVLEGEWPVFFGSVADKAVVRHVRVPIWAASAAAGRSYRIAFESGFGTAPPPLSFGERGSSQRTVTIARKAPPVGSIIELDAKVHMSQAAVSIGTGRDDSESGSRTVTRKARMEVLAVSSDGTLVTKLSYQATVDTIAQRANGKDAPAQDSALAGKTYIAESPDGESLTIVDADGNAASAEVGSELVYVLVPLMSAANPLDFSGMDVTSESRGTVTETRLRKLFGLQPGAGKVTYSRLDCKEIRGEGDDAVALLDFRANLSNEGASGVMVGIVRVHAATNLVVESTLKASTQGNQVRGNGFASVSQTIEFQRAYRIVSAGD